MSIQGRATPTLDTASLRLVLSRFATGIVVLSVGGEHVHGMTANAFTSVSLDPPRVLCCVSHSAVMCGAMAAARRFAVSILSADQEPLARYFADKSRPLGPAQFTSVDWRPGPRTGAPLLTGALAWLECELVESHDSGDHTIFIGGVLDSVDGSGPGGSGRPGLLFLNGRFHRLDPPPG